MLSEEEKKAYEEAKLYLEYIGVDDFNLEKHQCENRKWAIETILKIVEKQQKEIEELNEKISKAIGHIEVCKTTLGNYILTPNQIECLLNILREE